MSPFGQQQTKARSLIVVTGTDNIYCRLGRQQLSIPSSKHLVILKLHLIPGGLRTDQALAFKALAAEVLEAGYDFFILQDRVSNMAACSATSHALGASQLCMLLVI